MIILIVLIIILALIAFGLYMGYNSMISAPSNDDLILEFNVEKGSTYNSIAESLEKEGFIKNALCYKIYLKLNPVSDNLEYGKYYLPTNVDVKGIIDVLKKGSDTLADTLTVTFIEGKNMRYIISVINKNFGYSAKDILNQLKDKDYLDKLIDKYWFITKDIKNKNIYYSLEGYLYPDTYEFYTTASVDDIFRKLLNNMGKKLEKYKGEIEKARKIIEKYI